MQNIHVGLSPTRDYVAEGRSMNMTETVARAYLAKIQAEMQEQMLKTLASLPPPPCP